MDDVYPELNVTKRNIQLNIYLELMFPKVIFLLTFFLFLEVPVVVELVALVKASVVAAEEDGVECGRNVFLPFQCTLSIKLDQYI